MIDLIFGRYIGTISGQCMHQTPFLWSRMVGIVMMKSCLSMVSHPAAISQPVPSGMGTIRLQIHSNLQDSLAPASSLR